MDWPLGSSAVRFPRRSFISSADSLNGAEYQKANAKLGDVSDSHLYEQFEVRQTPFRGMLDKIVGDLPMVRRTFIEFSWIVLTLTLRLGVLRIQSSL